MRKLIAFNQVSLDGYFAGPGGDISWAHNNNQDAEWDAFVAGNASGGGVLVFGRVTYELMLSYWPTPLAQQNDPIVAERMNSGPKMVFSRTLDAATWSNTILVKTDPAAEMRDLKQVPGPRHGHSGQRQHRVAIGASRLDRRIPNGRQTRRAWQRENDVRGDQRAAQPEADQNADLRQRQCLAVLRADRVMAEPNLVARNS
jgi:dihydrofolate reductase